MQESQQETLTRSVWPHNNRTRALLDCQINAGNEPLFTDAIDELANAEREQRSAAILAAIIAGWKPTPQTRHTLCWMHSGAGATLWHLRSAQSG